LGALLASSEAAFNVMKFFGAAYLIWLGVQKWRSRPAAMEAGAASTPPTGHYLQGVLVNLTNPKAIIFIGALVPHFIDLSLPQWPQYLIIAATMCLTDWLVMSVYALAAARIAVLLRDQQVMQRQNRVFAALFVSAGALLALSSRPA
jgi:homoserine/homoserine lactone efflux protein